MAFLQNIGFPEVLVISLVLLLFFGARRLPELAKGLGKSMKEFKKATQDLQDDFQEAVDAADPKKPLPQQQRKAEPEAPAAPAPAAPVAPTRAEAEARPQSAPSA